MTPKQYVLATVPDAVCHRSHTFCYACGTVDGGWTALGMGQTPRRAWEDAAEFLDRLEQARSLDSRRHTSSTPV
jgi:hypothetical protein